VDSEAADALLGVDVSKSPCSALRPGAGFMSDLHLPLLGLFGAGFVLDVLWRGFCDWLDQ
jgi:hypothetical protein